MDFDEDYDDFDNENGGQGEFTDDYEEELSFFEKYKVAIIVVSVIVVLLIVGIGYTILSKPEEAPPVVEQAPVETISPEEQYQQELGESGIGKELAISSNVYNQGNLEDNTFRKDLLGVDAPENYVKPLKVTTVVDGVTYVKHRAMTGDGIDLYYLDLEYKGQAGIATISYSLYQMLPSEGTLDMNIEVITDSNGKVFATYFSQLSTDAYKKK